MAGLAGHPVLYFDGTCILCDSFFNWVIKHDKQEIFRFSTLQSKEGQEILERINYKMDSDTIVLVTGDKTYTHSTAVLRVFRYLGGGYKVLGYLGYLFPIFIRDSVYKLIAKYRYKLFGKQVCMIPDPGIRKRFIPFDFREPDSN